MLECSCAALHTSLCSLCKQEVKASIDKLHHPVEEALARKEEIFSNARPLEAQKIQETANLLNTNWDKLNKLYQDRLKWGGTELAFQI